MSSVENENETTSSSDEQAISKLQDHLAHREKKLKEMSILLADLNSELNEVLSINN